MEADQSNHFLCLVARPVVTQQTFELARHRPTTLFAFKCAPTSCTHKFQLFAMPRRKSKEDQRHQTETVHAFVYNATMAMCPSPFTFYVHDGQQAEGPGTKFPAGIVMVPSTYSLLQVFASANAQERRSQASMLFPKQKLCVLPASMKGKKIPSLSRDSVVHLVNVMSPIMATIRTRFDKLGMGSEEARPYLEAISKHMPRIPDALASPWDIRATLDALGVSRWAKNMPSVQRCITEFDREIKPACRDPVRFAMVFNASVQAAQLIEQLLLVQNKEIVQGHAWVRMLTVTPGPPFNRMEASRQALRGARSTVVVEGRRIYRKPLLMCIQLVRMTLHGYKMPSIVAKACAWNWFAAWVFKANRNALLNRTAHLGRIARVCVWVERGAASLQSPVVKSGAIVPVEFFLSMAGDFKRCLKASPNRAWCVGRIREVVRGCRERWGLFSPPIDKATIRAVSPLIRRKSVAGGSVGLQALWDQLRYTLHGNVRPGIVEEATRAVKCREVLDTFMEACVDAIVRSGILTAMDLNRTAGLLAMHGTFMTEAYQKKLDRIMCMCAAIALLEFDNHIKDAHFMWEVICTSTQFVPWSDVLCMWHRALRQCLWYGHMAQPLLKGNWTTPYALYKCASTRRCILSIAVEKGWCERPPKTLTKEQVEKRIRAAQESAGPFSSVDLHLDEQAKEAHKETETCSSPGGTKVPEEPSADQDATTGKDVGLKRSGEDGGVAEHKGSDAGMGAQAFGGTKESDADSVNDGMSVLSDAGASVGSSGTTTTFGVGSANESDSGDSGIPFIIRALSTKPSPPPEEKRVSSPVCLDMGLIPFDGDDDSSDADTPRSDGSRDGDAEFNGAFGGESSRSSIDKERRVAEYFFGLEGEPDEVDVPMCTSRADCCVPLASDCKQGWPFYERPADRNVLNSMQEPNVPPLLQPGEAAVEDRALWNVRIGCLFDKLAQNAQRLEVVDSGKMDICGLLSAMFCTCNADIARMCRSVKPGRTMAHRVRGTLMRAYSRTLRMAPVDPFRDIQAKLCLDVAGALAQYRQHADPGGSLPEVRKKASAFLKSQSDMAKRAELARKEALEQKKAATLRAKRKREQESVALLTSGKRKTDRSRAVERSAPISTWSQSMEDLNRGLRGVGAVRSVLVGERRGGRNLPLVSPFAQQRQRVAIASLKTRLSAWERARRAMHVAVRHFAATNRYVKAEGQNALTVMARGLTRATKTSAYKFGSPSWETLRYINMMRRQLGLIVSSSKMVPANMREGLQHPHTKRDASHFTTTTIRLNETVNDFVRGLDIGMLTGAETIAGKVLLNSHMQRLLTRSAAQTSVARLRWRMFLRMEVIPKDKQPNSDGHLDMGAQGFCTLLDGMAVHLLKKHRERFGIDRPQRRRRLTNGHVAVYRDRNSSVGVGGGKDDDGDSVGGVSHDSLMSGLSAGAVSNQHVGFDLSKPSEFGLGDVSIDSNVDACSLPGVVLMAGIPSPLGLQEACHRAIAGGIDHLPFAMYANISTCDLQDAIPSLDGVSPTLMRRRLKVGTSDMAVWAPPVLYVSAYGDNDDAHVGLPGAAVSVQTERFLMWVSRIPKERKSAAKRMLSRSVRSVSRMFVPVMRALRIGNDSTPGGTTAGSFKGAPGEGGSVSGFSVRSAASTHASTGGASAASSGGMSIVRSVLGNGSVVLSLASGLEDGQARSVDTEGFASGMEKLAHDVGAQDGSQWMRGGHLTIGDNGFSLRLGPTSPFAPLLFALPNSTARPTSEQFRNLVKLELENEEVKGSTFDCLLRLVHTRLLRKHARRTVHDTLTGKRISLQRLDSIPPDRQLTEHIVPTELLGSFNDFSEAFREASAAIGERSSIIDFMQGLLAKAANVSFPYRFRNMGEVMNIYPRYVYSTRFQASSFSVLVDGFRADETDKFTVPSLRFDTVWSPPSLRTVAWAHYDVFAAVPDSAQQEPRSSEEPYPPPPLAKYPSRKRTNKKARDRVLAREIEWMRLDAEQVARASRRRSVMRRAREWASRQNSRTVRRASQKNRRRGRDRRRVAAWRTAVVQEALESLTSNQMVLLRKELASIEREFREQTAKPRGHDAGVYDKATEIRLTTCAAKHLQLDVRAFNDTIRARVTGTISDDTSSDVTEDSDPGDAVWRVVSCDARGRFEVGDSDGASDGWEDTERGRYICSRSARRRNKGVAQARREARGNPMLKGRGYVASDAFEAVRSRRRGARISSSELGAMRANHRARRIARIRRHAEAQMAKAARDARSSWTRSMSDQDESDNETKGRLGGDSEGGDIHVHVQHLDDGRKVARREEVLGEDSEEDINEEVLTDSERKLSKRVRREQATRKRLADEKRQNLKALHCSPGEHPDVHMLRRAWEKQKMDAQRDDPDFSPHTRPPFRVGSNTGASCAQCIHAADVNMRQKTIILQLLREVQFYRNKYGPLTTEEVESTDMGSLQYLFNAEDGPAGAKVRDGHSCRPVRTTPRPSEALSVGLELVQLDETAVRDVMMKRMATRCSFVSPRRDVMPCPDEVLYNVCSEWMHDNIIRLAQEVPAGCPHHIRDVSVPARYAGDADIGDDRDSDYSIVNGTEPEATGKGCPSRRAERHRGMRRAVRSAVQGAASQRVSARKEKSAKVLAVIKEKWNIVPCSIKILKQQLQMHIRTRIARNEMALPNCIFERLMWDWFGIKWARGMDDINISDVYVLPTRAPSLIAHPRIPKKPTVMEQQTVVAAAFRDEELTRGVLIPKLRKVVRSDGKTVIRRLSMQDIEKNCVRSIGRAIPTASEVQVRMQSVIFAARVASLLRDAKTLGGVVATGFNTTTRMDIARSVVGFWLNMCSIVWSIHPVDISIQKLPASPFIPAFVWSKCMKYTSNVQRVAAELRVGNVGMDTGAVEALSLMDVMHLRDRNVVTRDVFLGAGYFFSDVRISPGVGNSAMHENTETLVPHINRRRLSTVLTPIAKACGIWCPQCSRQCFRPSHMEFRTRRPTIHPKDTPVTPFKRINPTMSFCVPVNPREDGASGGEEASDAT